jgi:hypothetical protein
MSKRHLRFNWNKRPIQSTLLILAVSFLLGATGGIAKAQDLAGGGAADDLNVMTWNIKGGELKRDEHSKKLDAVPCKRNSTPGYLENIEQEFEEEIRRHGRLDVIALQGLPISSRYARELSSENSRLLSETLLRRDS